MTKKNLSARGRYIKPLPSKETLVNILDYDADTGIFRWRVKPCPRIRSNATAGAHCRNGYVRICIKKSTYAAHRLAFVIMTGNCPSEIDHIDGNRSNNAWSNLRQASPSDNCMNRINRSDNASGARGVSWRARSNKWRSRIMVRGKSIELGEFNNIDDAANAYKLAAVKYFGDFCHPKIAGKAL